MLITFLVALVFFASLLSGFYPAIILSGFNPIAVLKNKITAHGSSGASVRKTLVVFQFLIAQILIIGTLIISDQMSFFQSKPLGFTKNAIINIPVPEPKKETIESLRARLDGRPDIGNISFSLGAPTSTNNFGTSFGMADQDLRANGFSCGIKAVDRHYLDAYGIPLKAGRWFTEADEKMAEQSIPKEDRKYSYVVTETAARQLGFNDPQDLIGKVIKTGVNDITRRSDRYCGRHPHHLASREHQARGVYEPARVLLRLRHTGGRRELCPNDQGYRKSWAEVFPEYYFEYEFLDDHLASLYRQDERTFTLFKIFAGVSIFIGCLGLYGLISFMANQKLKEVGIRKVLGASTSSIMVMFSKEFVKLIVLAFIIAAPLAWYFMNQWLQGLPTAYPYTGLRL